MSLGNETEKKPHTNEYFNKQQENRRNEIAAQIKWKMSEFRETQKKSERNSERETA